MDMLKKTVSTISVRLKSLLQFDVTKYDMNDCVEILEIIAHMSLDIH